MANLSKDLGESLAVKTAFSFKLGAHTIGVSESVVVTWIIMAMLVFLAIYLTHGLRAQNPGKKQIFLESVMSAGYNLFHDILGDNGTAYIPYLLTVMFYLGFANLIGIIGFTPPTKDINVTAALALMSIVLIEYSNAHHNGGKKFFKSFAEPLPLMTPINIMEVGIRPLSLCMRLFGNVLGSFVVMKLLEIICPLLLPIPFSMYFDIFDGLIQMIVFVFLTALFMQEGLTDE
ncbi:F0F1 ATP synthase subunit A [Pseudoramibacter porci]|uniref:ATP synthase subunit a n=1 Tax=Pseudoramibacter porci TaxID=2606631 RepID=A0A7X2NEH7_9FIRM|nr:F0F1 ATP synthase subunit A [Pseudoramibacter porci]